MKYWWLKRYKGLKIKLIPELTRQVNDNFIMPKNYKDRYSTIKNSDISKLNEEDLIIYLYCILNFERIKNNKVILIIERLLEIPDTSMPSTNYNLMEMYEEVIDLKKLKPLEEKISYNNIGACYTCLNVFYVDKIKYVNKKGYALCPYCRNHTLYFDNDFIPMDYNFLKLANLYYITTELGCNYNNIRKLIKKCITVVKDDISNYKTGAVFIKGDIEEDEVSLTNNNVVFTLKEITWKKEITSKEEKKIEFIFNRYLSIIEKNLINEIAIDTSIITSDKNFSLNLSLLLVLISNLGKNQYLRKIVLVCNNDDTYKIYKSFINILIK